MSKDLGLFRAICGVNQKFKLLVVSRQPLKNVFPDSKRGSEAYNLLVPLTLNEMNENEAKKVLSHPWMPDAPLFSDETIDEIISLCNGHPFKIQRAANHCFMALTEPSYDWQAGFRLDMAHML